MSAHDQPNRLIEEAENLEEMAAYSCKVSFVRACLGDERGAGFWSGRARGLELAANGLRMPTSPSGKADLILTAEAMPLKGEHDTDAEDAAFEAQYRVACSRFGFEDVARTLSGRLRQMDKRTKAANLRADAAEAELKRVKAALETLARAQTNQQPAETSDLDRPVASSLTQPINPEGR